MEMQGLLYLILSNYLFADMHSHAKMANYTHVSIFTDLYTFSDLSAYLKIRISHTCKHTNTQTLDKHLQMPIHLQISPRSKFGNSHRSIW